MASREIVQRSWVPRSLDSLKVVNSEVETASRPVTASLPETRRPIATGSSETDTGTGCYGRAFRRYDSTRLRRE
jgi:hypothetical protein